MLALASTIKTPEGPSSLSSTPASSGVNTPEQTRPSSPEHHHKHHNEHHIQHTMKKLWKDLKHHAVEHHRSVNAAYASYYAAGHGIPQPKDYRGEGNSRSNSRIA